MRRWFFVLLAWPLVFGSSVAFGWYSALSMNCAEGALCVAAEPGAWRYRRTVSSYVAEHATEAAAVNDLVTVLRTGNVACDLPTVSALGAWTTEYSGGANFTLPSPLAGLPQYEVRPITLTYHVWEEVRDANGNIIYNGPWPVKTCTKPASYSSRLYRQRGVSCPIGTLPTYDTSTNQDVCGVPIDSPVASFNFGSVLPGIHGQTSACSAGLAAEETLCGTYGNPVNPANGNKFQIETDFVGAGAFPLEFKRYYNSGKIAHAITTRLGVGWGHTYVRKIQFDARANRPTAFAHRPDGKLWAFTYANGEFTPAYAFTARLQKTETGYRLTTPGNLVEDYDLEGFLVAVHHRGAMQHLNYNDKRELVSVTDDAGRALRFEYSNGWLTKLTDSGGGVHVYANASNKLTQVTNPDGTTRQYIYDSPVYTYLLTGIVDEAGKRYATYAYTADKKVASSEHAGGALRHSFSYTGNATTVVTDSGETITDTFQIRRGAQLRAGHASPQRNTTARFSDTGRLDETVGADGSTTRYSTDPLGRETQRIEAAGTALERAIETQWHPEFMLPTQIRYPDHTEDLAYDAEGNVLRRTLTAGAIAREWRYTYVDGRLTEIDGLRSDVDDRAVLTYDGQGNLTHLTDAAGQTTQFLAYDAAGRLLSAEDAAGLRTDYRYDARGRLLEMTRGTETTRWTRNAYGAVTQIDTPEGAVWRFGYDDAHRLVAVTDPQGYQQQLILNAAGQPTETTVLDPQGVQVAQQRAEYDPAGRLSRALDAAGHATVFGFDASGRLSSRTSALGATQYTEYDLLGRVLRETDPSGGATAYQYTPGDVLAQVRDPRGVTTGYQANGLGEILATVSPDSGTTQQDLDAAGNVVTVTDARGLTTTQTFDALNRLVRRGYADGTEVRFSYAAGTEARIAEMLDPTGVTRWAYDAQGRETVKTQELDGLTFTTVHRYDAAGQRVATTLPSGAEITYRYARGAAVGIDVDGQPVVTAVARGYGGQLLTWQYANGRAGGYQRDLSGRVSGYWLGDALVEVRYDAAGRVVGVGAAEYGYDAKDRLVQYTGAAGSGGFAYDAGDNRIWTTDGVAQDYAYATDSNRLLSVTGVGTKIYAYDAAGNILSAGELRLGYDAAGRVASAQRVAKFAYRGQPPAALVTAQYRYNGLGQRVAKQVSGEIVDHRYFTYTEDGQLAGEYAVDGSVIAEYVYLDGAPVAVVQGGVVYAIQPDHLGTPRAVLDSAGAVAWTWVSDPFGQVLPNEEVDGDGVTFSLNLRFPGQYYDAETGTHYNYFRDYDPATGRYVQSDPIGLAGGLNTYGYVGGDPVRMVDPTGEFAVNVGGAVVSAILDIGVQLVTNGGRIECIKLDAVAIAAVAGAVNPFSIGAGLYKLDKANKQLLRAYNLRPGSRSAKRIEYRSDKNRTSGINQILSLVAIESGAEMTSNLIPDDAHLIVKDLTNNEACECR